MATAEVSHGRGGAGNMHPDDTKYVDGSVVRSGIEGSHGDGAYSAGRGGAGNIGDVGTAASVRKDEDVVPESAIRHSMTEDHHTGRGGAGNEQKAIHHEKTAGEKARAEGTVPVGLADKLKRMIFKK